MKTPTAEEIRTAMKVLTMFRDQLHTETAHVIKQLPGSSLGKLYADQASERAAEKCGRIDDILAQLECWRATLRNSRGIRL